MTNDEYIAELYSTVQPLVTAFLDAASKEGFNLRITAGFRTFEEQDALYAKGRTEPGRIVTNAKGGESFHNFGLAIDVVDTKNLYNIDWDRLGSIGESVGLEHGDRGYVDRPHFQYRGGLTLEQVQAGERPGEYKPEQPQEPDNKPTEKHMALYDSQYLVYVPKNAGTSFEYYVIKRHNVDPLETAHKVSKKHYHSVVALFKDQPNGIQLMKRKAQQGVDHYLEGLTQGPAYKPNREFEKHGELARMV